jgi:hypothetical protein
VAWGAAWLTLATGCASTPPDDLGTYGLHADAADRACQLAEVSAASFDFEVRLARTGEDGGATLAVGGYARGASWDGQVVRSTASAERVFAACPCGLSISETISLALLSQSQAEAGGLRCPPRPLDGGVPAPDADAGITRPAFSAGGFDAILACGELSTRLELVPDGGACPAGCVPCTTRFALTGVRR